MSIAAMLRGAYEHLMFWTAYVCFGLGGLAVTLVSALLYPLLPRRLGAQVGKRCISCLFRLYLRGLRAARLLQVDLRELDALRGQHSLIIAPNHPSLLDAVLVISRLPEVGCIMKAAIWDNPVLGGGARLAGYIRSDSPMAMMRRAAEEVKAGGSLLVFPEGTRTRQYPVNRFKGGFALIAKRAQAPVQTVFIETDSPFLGKTWPFLRKPRFPLTYRARLGKRFHVEGNVQQFLAALEAYYRRELSGRATSERREAIEQFQPVEGSSA